MNTLGQARAIANVKPGVVQHPLGRLVYRARARRPWRARLIAGGVFAVCAGVLSVAAYLRPDPSGVGTHKQLGMAPCVAVSLFGLPCPTCGMTTAFAYAVRGRLWSSFSAQPAGCLFALVTVAVACLSLGVVITGKVWAVNWYRVSPTRVTVAVLLIVLGGWAYKLAAGWITGTLPYGGS